MNDPIHNEHMDDFYKNILQDYKADPDDFVWEAIDSQLETPKPESTVGFNYWGFLGVFVLGIGIVFIQSFDFNVEETVAPKMSMQVQDESIGSLEDIQLAQTNDELVLKEEQHPKSILTKNSVATGVIQNQIQGEFMNSETVINNEFDLIKEENKDTERVLKPNYSDFNKNTRNTNEMETGVYHQPKINSVNLPLKKVEENISVDKYEIPEFASATSIETNGTSPILSENKIRNANKLISFSLDGLLPNVELPINIKPQTIPVLLKNKNEKSTYALGVFVGIGKGVWTSIENNSDDDDDYSKTKTNSIQKTIGFSIDKTLNGKWNLQSGLYIQNLNNPLNIQGSIEETSIDLGVNMKQYNVQLFSNNHDYLMYSKGMRFNSAISIKGNIDFEATQLLRYLSIPFSINRTLTQTGNLNIQAGLGLNANFLLSNRLQLLDFEAAGYYLNGFDLADDGGLNSFYIGGSLNISAQYFMTPKWSIRTTALVSRNFSAVSSINTHQTRFQYQQLQTGIFYTF